MLKYSRHGNCPILKTKVWRGESQGQLCRGQKWTESLPENWTQVQPLCSACSPELSQGAVELSASKTNQVHALFPRSDTINYRIRSYLSLLSSAVSVYLRTSSLSLGELFYILRGSRIIESLYHFAQQKIFLNSCYFHHSERKLWCIINRFTGIPCAKNLAMMF